MKGSSVEGVKLKPVKFLWNHQCLFTPRELYFSFSWDPKVPKDTKYITRILEKCKQDMKGNCNLFESRFPPLYFRQIYLLLLDAPRCSTEHPELSWLQRSGFRGIAWNTYRPVGCASAKASQLVCGGTPRLDRSFRHSAACREVHHQRSWRKWRLTLPLLPLYAHLTNAWVSWAGAVYLRTHLASWANVLKINFTGLFAFITSTIQTHSRGKCSFLVWFQGEGGQMNH